MATVSTPNAFFKGALLDMYYSRRAESAIGQGTRFEIKKAYFGTSALVTANPAGGWLIADIPTNFKLSDLLTNFASVNLTRTVTAGSSTINLNATLAADALSGDTANNFNTLVLTDADNNAIAVLCCQQDTLYRGKSFTLLMNIEEKVS